MNRPTIWILALLAAAPLARAATDAEALLSEAAAAAENALAMVECTYKDQAGTSPLTGVAICYDAEKGDFLTLAFGSNSRADSIQKLRLILPGPRRKSIEAELLGLRPEAGIGFLRAKEKQNWKAIRFAQRSNLSTGQMVVSAGLMPGDPANTPYFGIGQVSAKLRVPEEVYYVTGGRLTCLGSPVFISGGKAVGLVAQSLYLDYQVPTGRGPTKLSLKGTQETAFFMPVEEFAYVFQRIPEPGRELRPAWMGVLKAQGLGEEQAGFMKLDKPAITLDQVIPGTPAEQAGLKSGDVIVALDGKPLEELATPELTGRNFLRKVMLLPPGQKVTLTVRREGKESDVDLTLTAIPVLPDEAPRYLHEKLSLMVREKVPLGEYLDSASISKSPGLVVVGLGERGSAAAAGLKSLDVITAINGQPVKTVEGFKSILTESLTKEPGKAVVLMIRRGEEEPQAISIKPPSVKEPE